MAIALLAGCGATELAAVAPARPLVRVYTVGAGTGRAEIVATGTIALRRETALGFTSPGRIASIRVDDGDGVARGQVLAALDTTSVGAELSAARAERDRAAAEFQRSATLLRQGWVTRARLDSAQAALATADARVRATGFQSSAATIVAPGPGRVLARLGEPGQVIAAGTPVLILGETASGYVVRVPMTDRDAQRVRIGAPAVVALTAQTSVAGRVSEIAGRSDRLTGTFAVEVTIPESTGLRSGQIATARIVAADAVAATIAVPPAAVFAPRAGEGFVYVVDARDRLRLRKVVLGEADDATVRVTAGLRAGEVVAVSRLDRLSDGMRIRRAPAGATLTPAGG